MRNLGWGVVLLVASLAVAPAALAQSLSLVGPDGQTAQLDAAALAALPHVTVTVKQHGETHSFQGVPLGDLVARVGAATGKQVHGAELATVIRVTAADGYQVAISLAETDPATRADRVILADRSEAGPLTADGPFRLVVEGDLRPARAARNVVKLEVLRLATSAPAPSHGKDTP